MWVFVFKTLCLSWLMPNRCSLIKYSQKKFPIDAWFLSTNKIWKFQFFLFMTIQSFHASFVIGFTCIAIFFFYPSCIFAVIPLIVFHAQHEDTLLNWAFTWLINFWVLYILVYAFFSWCVNYWKLETFFFY